MKKFFFFIFLTSCSSLNSNYSVNNQNFSLNKNLSFDEFKQLVIEYAKSSPYPDIDR